MPSLKVINARVITPLEVLDNTSVLIEDGKIAAFNSGIEADSTIDACGRYMAPGFIDIHVHGGGGHDFMDCTVEAFLGVAETHARFGTTSMFPTTVSTGKPQLLAILATFDEALRLNVNGASLLGLHLEGPYLAAGQRGAQDVRYLRSPVAAEYEEILACGRGHIKRWSAAPELAGALEFGQCMRANGVLPAIAHSDAVYDEVLLAVQNGYTLVTHLYSCMSGVTRRNGYRLAGVIESAFLLDRLDVEVIADGHHVGPELLQLIYKIKGLGNIALITDAMRGAGMPEGDSVLGNIDDGMRVIVEGGVARLPDRSAFAGSVATCDRLVRNMIFLAGVPLVDAVRMMTATPARIMQVDSRKGSLVLGKDADFVLFNDAIEVSLTAVGGKVVFSLE